MGLLLISRERMGPGNERLSDSREERQGEAKVTQEETEVPVSKPLASWIYQNS